MFVGFVMLIKNLNLNGQLVLYNFIKIFIIDLIGESDEEIDMGKVYLYL